MDAQLSTSDLKAAIRLEMLRRVGRQYAIRGRELAGMYGYTDDRVVRKAIEELIDDHFPICSATDEPCGYFFPASVEEARRYSKGLQSRAVRIFLRRRNIIRDAAIYHEGAHEVRLV